MNASLARWIIRGGAKFSFAASSPSVRTFASTNSLTSLSSFIPNWMKRGSSETEELSPAELLGHRPPQAAAESKFEPRIPLEYRPAPDMEERLSLLWRRAVGARTALDPADFETTRVDDDDGVKFLFLDACVTEFRKRIPGADLDDMITLADVRDFFARPLLPADKTLERLRDEDAPPNLHVIPDYMTFEEEMALHHERDVYPHRDIIISSLRERGKYKSVRKPKCPWEEAEGFFVPPKYKRHQGF